VTTAIVVIDESHRIDPLPHVSSLNRIVKEERVATKQERVAVLQRFHARTIL
jgi:hypothetical protein